LLFPRKRASIIQNKKIVSAYFESFYLGRLTC
jgi:hypothetical protein